MVRKWNVPEEEIEKALAELKDKGNYLCLEVIEDKW